MAEEKTPIQKESEQEMLSEADKFALQLAKSQHQLAIAKARTAVAESETAEANYKYTVLQVYMKYKLTNNDTIQEATGIIIRGGTKKQV